MRPAGSGSYQQLSPRVKITSVPYSIKSQSADSATNASNAITAGTATNALSLGGVAANQYVQTTDVRLTDARPPTAGSASYIQNQNSAAQLSTSFNIGGTGRAYVFDASVFSSGGSVILRHGVIFGHLAVGINAGDSTTKGIGNTYVGNSAGRYDSSASASTMVGYRAGELNVSGFNNSFFGYFAGKATTANNNSFFGAESGAANTTGQVNSFYGSAAGKANTIGSDNTYIGTAAGLTSTTGNENTFLGRSAGRVVTTGNRNTFVGFEAGNNGTTGSDNTTIGAGSDISSGTITFATAIGAGSVANLSNSVFLGRSNGLDTVRVPGSVSVNGIVVVGSLGGTNTNNHLCRNSLNQIAGCTANFAEKSEIDSLTREHRRKNTGQCV